MFVDFLPEQLLTGRKVVIAHGVQRHGDNVFHAFEDQFQKLSENDFVSFWCIYFTSLITNSLSREISTNHTCRVHGLRLRNFETPALKREYQKSGRRNLCWTSLPGHLAFFDHGHQDSVINYRVMAETLKWICSVGPLRRLALAAI